MASTTDNEQEEKPTRGIKMAREKDIFLVAKYVTAPKNPKRTHIKGYMKDDDNISFNEQVVVTRGLKDRDLTAAIILNVTQQTVQKCRYELGEVNDWETLASYYSKGYPQYLTLLKPEAEAEPEPLDGDEELVSIGEKGELVLKDTATDYDVDMDKERLEGEDGPDGEDGPWAEGYEERAGIADTKSD